MPLQQTVNQNWAPGVEGDFASANLSEADALTIPGGFVSGPAGVTTGRFCWMDPAAATGRGTLVNSFGVGLPTGFVGRQQMNAGIVTYLAETSNVIVPGQPVNVFR